MLVKQDLELSPAILKRFGSPKLFAGHSRTVGDLFQSHSIILACAVVGGVGSGSFHFQKLSIFGSHDGSRYNSSLLTSDLFLHALIRLNIPGGLCHMPLAFI